MIVRRYRVVLIVDASEYEPTTDITYLCRDLTKTLENGVRDLEAVRVESAEFVEELPA